MASRRPLVIRRDVDGGIAELPAADTVPPSIISTVPICRLTRSGHQSIPNNVGTTMQWDVAIESNDGMWTGSDNTKITFQTAGLYLITWALWYPQNGTGSRTGLLYYGGTGGTLVQFISVGAIAANAVGIAGAYQGRFGVGNHVILQTSQDSGAPLEVQAWSQFGALFSATRLSA
jgi:hypothetical protein